MLNISSLTTLDISAIIVLASVVLYYFGRLIADTHVEQADKSALYVTGFIFVVFFILIPGIVVLLCSGLSYGDTFRCTIIPPDSNFLNALMDIKDI